jgi:toxin ParE1/3/4
MSDSSIIRSPASEQDLIDIWHWVAFESPSAADRLLDSISNRILQLADFPSLGRSRSDILPDMRSLTVGNHLILYRFAENTVTVVRIVHGARDLTALF